MEIFVFAGGALILAVLAGGLYFGDKAKFYGLLCLVAAIVATILALSSAYQRGYMDSYNDLMGPEQPQQQEDYVNCQNGQIKA